MVNQKIEEIKHNHPIVDKGTHTTSAFHFGCEGCQTALKELMSMVKK